MNVRTILLALLLLAACTRSGDVAPERKPRSGDPAPPAVVTVDGPGTASTASAPAPHKPEVPDGRAVATLAGGCFWGMEELLRAQPGVIDTKVGYTGGKTADPIYLEVKKGDTGHAESVQIIYDPAKTSYEKLVAYFFKIHDPTTVNRQGNDIGTQYRSVIFYHSEEQRKIAEKVRARVNASGAYKGEVVTRIVPARPFTLAEDYHQDFLQKHPDGYTCHFERQVSF